MHRQYFEVQKEDNGVKLEEVGWESDQRELDQEESDQRELDQEESDQRELDQEETGDDAKLARLLQ